MHQPNKNIKASDILANNVDLQLQESVSWSVWKKVVSRYELLHVTGSFQTLLQEIDNLWPSFVTHSFYTREQRGYISLIKEKSDFTTYAPVLVDFAQNFSFITEQEIQSAYYSRQ